MRRADRLFQIVQILRRAKQPVSARAISEELEVSIRTVYRDISDLMAHRTPIRGEAGVGYVLEAGHDLPPLMLTHDEIEAAVLGVQWVVERADPALARSARDLLAKIEAVLPEGLRAQVGMAPVLAPPSARIQMDATDMEPVRAAIREGRKLRLSYRDEKGRDSARIIWPVSIVYFDEVRLLAGWCETRSAFRHFRTDRIVTCEVMDVLAPADRRRLKQDWLMAKASEQAQTRS